MAGSAYALFRETDGMTFFGYSLQVNNQTYLKSIK